MARRRRPPHGPVVPAGGGRPGEAARARREARGKPLDLARCRSRSIRAPSGARSTARCGGSSATSSTTRTCTAWTLKALTAEVRALPRRHRQPRRPDLPAGRHAGRDHGPAHLPRRRRAAGADAASRAVCSAPTTRSRTAATASPGSTAARTGTRGLRAPLTEPGVNVKEGDYLLAVNGKAADRRRRGLPLLRAHRGQGRAPHRGSDPGGKGARDVTVVPIADEESLRLRAWMDDNRRKVDQPERRPAGLRLPAGHRAWAATRTSTATTSPRSNATARHRRALQRRRLGRRLHRGLAEPAAAR